MKLKEMKKLLIVAMACVLVTSLAACGSNEPSSDAEGATSGTSGSPDLGDMEKWLDEHEMDVNDMVMMGNAFNDETTEGCKAYMTELTQISKNKGKLSGKQQNLYDRFDKLYTETLQEAGEKLNGLGGIQTSTFGSDLEMTKWMLILGGRNDNWILGYTGDAIGDEGDVIQVDILVDGRSIMIFEKTLDELDPYAGGQPGDRFQLNENGVSLESGEYTAKVHLSRNVDGMNSEGYQEFDLKVVVK